MNQLVKKLTKKFNKPNVDNFKLTGDNLCDECVMRHNELYHGRVVTFEDLQSSCYSHIFYKPNTFLAIIPILLKELIIKQKFEIDRYIMEIVFEKMRHRDIVESSFYTKEQKEIIKEALEYLQSIYHMDYYEVWDEEKEEIIDYFEEKSIYEEISKTIKFWKEDIEP